MTPPAKESTTTDYGSTVNISNNVTVVALVFFFILVLFFTILYLYAKHVWVPERSLRRRLRHRRSRLIFAAETAPLPRRGLDSTILRALPITIFSSTGLEEELDCAVCLCELTDGEEVRMLPKCNHGFHLECIDMWFHSHSNCPLCRCPVGLPLPKSDAGFDEISDSESAVEVGIPSSSPDAQPSSSVSTGKPDGMLVIDIPKRVMQGFSSSPSTPLPTSDDYENQMMATKTTTPTSARLRTLTRLLSRGKRAMVGPSAASPRETEDIEQGQGLLPPRGPAGESRRGATPRINKNS